MSNKISRVLTIIIVWAIIGNILSYFIEDFNWDFYIGGLCGYTIATISTFKVDDKPIKTNKETTKAESEIDDHPWYH